MSSSLTIFQSFLREWFIWKMQSYINGYIPSFAYCISYFLASSTTFVSLISFCFFLKIKQREKHQFLFLGWSSKSICYYEETIYDYRGVVQDNGLGLIKHRLMEINGSSSSHRIVLYHYFSDFKQSIDDPFVIVSFHVCNNIILPLENLAVKKY